MGHIFSSTRPCPIDPAAHRYYTSAMNPQRRANNTPIISLTTDFGVQDSYVAEMKAVLLTHCPDVRLVDVTHSIAPHDVLAASVTLERTLRVFPKGTIHVAVVDPGVGTARKLLLVEIKGQFVFCPDNGLITWPWRRLPNAARARELTWPPGWESCTFHGRDILAPAAAMLASGQMHLGDLTAPDPIEPQLLDVAPAAEDARKAVVIYVDHFGNATTNAPAEIFHLKHPKAIRIKGKSIGPLRKTYAEVPSGKPLALIGSSGLLEVAIHQGDAGKRLGLKVGQPLTIDY
jgi:S-adenosylmethionine hydrolase